MCGSEVMFGAHPYAWMKAGNLLASLASLSPEYLALACSVCPRGLLSPCFVNSIHLQQLLEVISAQIHNPVYRKWQLHLKTPEQEIKEIK